MSAIVTAHQPLQIEMPKKGDQTALKNIVKKLGSINNSIANIVDEDESANDRLKQIKAEKKRLCQKLLKEEKELKKKMKANTEKRLLMLGERESYKNLLTELGAKIKSQELKDVTKQISNN